jgi:hypothetical protein
MGSDGIGLMARPKRGIKTMPVRLTDEAIAVARIASGYTGETMADYVSRIVVERANEDIDRLHAERVRKTSAEPEPPPKPPISRRKP